MATRTGRKVGEGMKPRNAEKTNLSTDEVQAESINGAMQPVLSTDEVQQEPVLESKNAVLSTDEVHPEGVNGVIEGVFVGEAEGGDHKLSSLQILDSEPVVVKSEVSDPILGVQNDTLESILKQSEVKFTVQPITGREFANLGGPTMGDLEKAVVNDGKAYGELPNGEYRTTVRIGEGYIEGIKSQAESDGVSLEDWLTFQLQERLEQWFFAVGAK